VGWILFLRTFGYEAMKKLYLDIDGVLLTKRNTSAADNSKEFIDFVIHHFDCYWLTTHCKGNSGTTIQHLAKFFDEKTLEKLSKIKATNWTTLKTESIDFSSDFFWIDDYAFEAEKNVLSANSSLSRLIIVDLNRKDELKRVMNILLRSLLKK